MRTDIVIRQAEPSDAVRLVDLFTTLYQESDYLLLEHGEFKVSAAEEAKLIEKNMSAKSWALYVAEQNSELVGFLGGNGGSASRNKHTIQIAMGVCETSQGKGVGRKLLQAFIGWASFNQYHRLELSVIETNIKAISLYKSMGFEIEGLKRNSLKVNGSYVNEHYMAKFI